MTAVFTVAQPESQEPVYRGPALFSYGFRPFFLGAALFAGVAVPAWVLMLAGSGGPEHFYPPRDWHVHEMLFGFLPAVMAGFLLTAVPNWTERPPVRGIPLATLFTLWVTGRVMMAWPVLPAMLVMIVDGAFLIALATVVWREITAAGSWGQAPIISLVSLYAGDNLFFHWLAWKGLETDLPERIAMGLIMILLAAIGGRITPNFTRELLSQRGTTNLPPPFSRFDRIALLAMVISAPAWIVQPEALATGWILTATGIVQLIRLGRWRGWEAWREPLVWVLHIGYGWLALSILTIGAAALPSGIPPANAVHVLTAGAVGTMTLAVMTRASLGHTGHPRHARPATVLLYGLVNLGAALRVVAPPNGLSTDAAAFVLPLAAGCWSGPYLLFAVIYGPLLFRPSLDDSDV